jgi:hypothetical protein
VKPQLKSARLKSRHHKLPEADRHKIFSDPNFTDLHDITLKHDGSEDAALNLYDHVSDGARGAGGRRVPLAPMPKRMAPLVHTAEKKEKGVKKGRQKHLRRRLVSVDLRRKIFLPPIVG